MSFVYVGTDRTYQTMGRGRHLQNEISSEEWNPEAAKESDVSILGLIQNREDQRVKEEGYEKHAFNELISNRLGFHREIEDTRHEL